MDISNPFRVDRIDETEGITIQPSVFNPASLQGLGLLNKALIWKQINTTDYILPQSMYAQSYGQVQIFARGLGTWNMDTVASKFIGAVHGGRYICHISAVIFNDNGVEAYPIDYVDAGWNIAGKIIWDHDLMKVERRAGGFFDSVSFDDTTYNRGFTFLWEAMT